MPKIQIPHKAKGIIVFDLDETLVNTYKKLIKPAFDQMAIDLSGLPAAEAIAKMEAVYDDRGCAIHYFVELGAGDYAEAHTQVQERMLKLLPTLPDYSLTVSELHALQNAGYVLSVLTHSMRFYAESVLQHIGAIDCFAPELIVSVCDNDRKSKDGEGEAYEDYMTRIEKLNPNVPHIMVEDKMENLKPAKAHGFHTVFVGDNIPDNGMPDYVDEHHKNALHFMRSLVECGSTAA